MTVPDYAPHQGRYRMESEIRTLITGYSKDIRPGNQMIYIAHN
jgi:hypothetical protein